MPSRYTRTPAPRRPWLEGYRAAAKVSGGACPIECGTFGRLADNECRHGRLDGDRSTPCGCWPSECVPAEGLTIVQPNGGRVLVDEGTAFGEAIA